MVRRIKRKELPEDVAQGQREQSDLEKFQAEQAPVEEEQPQFKESSGLGVGKLAAKAKDVQGIPGVAANLAAAPFRGAERVALEFLDLVGVGSDEQIENAREQLNLGSGNILKDPDVQDLALTVGSAGVGKLIGAGVQGARAAKVSKNVLRANRSTPVLADLTGLSRVGTTIRKQRQIAENIPNIAKRFVRAGSTPVTQKSVKNVAKGLSQMPQSQKVNLLNKGFNWAKRNKAKATVAVGLAGANATWYWGASDNIATGAQMRVNEAVDAVRFSGLPKAEARRTINQAKAQANLALSFQIASQLNPLVSLTGGWVMIGNTLATKRAIEEQERNLQLL